MAAAFLMSSCFGVIAQALPAALMDATSKVRAVTILGQLGSASAFCDSLSCTRCSSPPGLRCADLMTLPLAISSAVAPNLRQAVVCVTI